MSVDPAAFRFVSTNRRVREDRRFVAGHGNYVADIVPEGTLHVAVLSSQHPSARILSIDSSAALAMPGVHYVLTGEELATAVDPLMNGLDTPNARRFPLAVGQTRYAGEWVAAVVADTRALAEDATEKLRVNYEPLPYVINAEEALKPDSPPVHPAHGSNVLLDKTFVWGEVEKDFADSPRHLSFRVTWGRNSTVPIETFGVVASWDSWREMLDVWASIQMPKYPDQIARALRIPANNVRVHQDVDVGGSYGVKRGIKHTVLVSHLSRRLGRPVRLIEDRLENMRGGDAHGPERIFDIEVAFNDDGIVRSMKMKALDNAGGYAGRAPFQLGKPIGAIVGPYKINSVQYRAQSVTSNKAVQEAVRGFGQSPTNYAIETMMDKVADAVGISPLEIRRRNFINHDEFPYLIPSGTRYDSGDYHTVMDKVLAHVDYPALEKERDRLRESGLLAGIGIAACLEPSGGNSSFEPLLNEKNTTTTWMDSCRINVDGVGFVTVTIHTTSSGQGHETLVATVIGEVLQIDPDKIRVVRPDSLASLPSNTPVGSRMAIMLGGAAFHAAQKLRTKLIKIAAHKFGCGEDEVTYANGSVTAKNGAQLSWSDLVNIGHRHFHELPEGMEPGLETTHVMQVPTGTKLPENGRVQMYPCHSFEFHVVLIAIDPVLGKPEIRRYVIGHDCGTVINPHIVKGMTLGGIAHGIGAALLEEFVYDGEGQMLTQSFMDYLLPSSHEVPEVEIVHHCTPSPYTVFGQKGSGESGYLGAPAAISNGINDAVRSLGISFAKLPIRISAISDAVASAKQK
ncbi:MAG: xanthine dehydrogenase family protein molybdopterin-binding subunit [Afipia sp.]